MAVVKNDFAEQTVSSLPGSAAASGVPQSITGGVAASFVLHRHTFSALQA